MKPKTSVLGLAMMAPALVLLAFFFFAPVAFTTVFAFTNMSTSTGIGDGDYVITPNLLRQLGATDIDQDALDAVGKTGVVVDETTLAAAREGGVDAAFLAEIEAELLGKSFESSREFERTLRNLPSRPRSVQALKSAADYFSFSVLNHRFDTAEGLGEALSELASGVNEQTRDRIVAASYSGAIYTTENFTSLAISPSTWRIVANTVLYVGLTLGLFNVSLGLFLAIVLFYMPRKTSVFFTGLWLLPRITPVVLYTIMWKWFTWEGGFLPSLAANLGLPAFNYMKGSVLTAWTTMILINGFVGASFGLILFSGALRSIPVQQLWASEVDGATRWQQVWRIILPQLRWPILFVTAYQTLSLLSSYEMIWLTTNGGPGKTTTVWALEAFKTALSNYSGNLQYGLGAAMALVLVVVGLGLSILYLKLFKFNELIGRPRIEY